MKFGVLVFGIAIVVAGHITFGIVVIALATFVGGGVRDILVRWETVDIMVIGVAVGIRLSRSSRDIFILLFSNATEKRHGTG